MASPLEGPWLRRLILRQGRKLSVEKMQARGAAAALRSVAQAARTSAAYRRLLAEAGLPETGVLPGSDLARAPVLTKDNTFGRFALRELCAPLEPRRIADVLTSSGRGGRVFGLRLTGRRELERSAFDVDLGLQDAFGIDERPTLLVNCLPMGVTFRSGTVTVANVSVREDMACAVLQQLGPLYAQTVVCTDPLFVRRLLDQAREVGLDWAALNTSFVVGEEVLVEAQRDHIARAAGIALDDGEAGRGGGAGRTVASSFGVGELGLNLLFESRATIALRRAMRRDAAVAQRLAGRAFAPGRAVPSVFACNPMRCHVEVVNADADGFGELCFTLNDRHALLPLPRYATGDVGRLVDRASVLAVCRSLGLEPPWLPLVLVAGRAADAGALSVEDVKECVYVELAVADRLTGAFRMHAAVDGAAPRLVLQLAGPADPAFERVARDRLSAGPLTGWQVDFVAADAAPWRPALDYERKFSYRA